MIEILEMKKNKEMHQVEMENEVSRVFVFRDGQTQLGSLHFIRLHPHLVKLTTLEFSDAPTLSRDLILDGLLRTACHTFHSEKIFGVIVEEEQCREHNLNANYFTPMAEIMDEMAGEIEPDFTAGREPFYLMKTDMIYKGCCKGV